MTDLSLNAVSDQENSCQASAEENGSGTGIGIALPPIVGDDQNAGVSLLDPPIVNPEHSQQSQSSSRSTSRSSRRHRSRSSGRSHSRCRHSSRRSRSRYSTHFFKERNFPAAFFGMFSIVLLCVALESDWIKLKGGGCCLIHSERGTLHQLSTMQFFYAGHFYKKYPFTEKGDVIYQFGPGKLDVMLNCVTYQVAQLFKTSIALVILAIVTSFIAFLLDLIGPTQVVLRHLKRNAIFSIITSILCVAILLFTYWINTLVENLQRSTRLQKGSKIEVTFSVSFYIVTAAGALSVLATACSCLRGRMRLESSNNHCAQDAAMFDDLEALLSHASSEDVSAPTSAGVPPPAYTP